MDVLRKKYNKTELLEDGINGLGDESEWKLVCDLIYTIQCIKVGFNKQSYNFDKANSCEKSHWFCKTATWYYHNYNVTGG